MDSSIVELSVNSMTGQSPHCTAAAFALEEVLCKAATATIKSVPWRVTTQPAGLGHKVQVNFLIQGMKKEISMEGEPGKIVVGFETHLMGHKASNRAQTIDFIVQKLPVSHPLSPFAGKHVSGQLLIKKVMVPPMPMPELDGIHQSDALKLALLHLMRELPLALCPTFATHLQTEVRAAPSDIRNGLEQYILALNEHSQLQKKLLQLITTQLDEIGAPRDPETEMAFLRAMLKELELNQHRIEPPLFCKHIASTLQSMLKHNLESVIKQIHTQQNAIRRDVREYHDLDQDKSQLQSLQQEFEEQRKRGASKEVLRRTRIEIDKLESKMRRVALRFQTNLGVILMQEMLMDGLKRDVEMQLPLRALDAELEEMTLLIKENYRSVNRELVGLGKKLGEGGKRMLLQTALLGDRETDPAHTTDLESIGVYDTKNVAPLMILLPSLAKKLGKGGFTANELLTATMESDITSDEKKVFNDYVEKNPHPRNHEMHRMTSQLSNFIELIEDGSGINLVHTHFEKEMEMLKVVVALALEQNKLNTDFKNHLSYYLKLFLEPLWDLLKKNNHESFRELNISWDRLRNNLAVTFKLRYTTVEESTLLATFRYIAAQLQNEELFHANEFQRQLQAFLEMIKHHRRAVSTDLLRKILATYTIFMMGCSRTRKLATNSSGRLSRIDVDAIRRHRDGVV